MNFEILALSDRIDLSGLLCLATILWVIILIIAYCFGPIVGSFTCFIFFIIALFGTMDSRSQGGGGSLMVTEHFIANGHGKFIKQFKYSINHPDCIFSIPLDRGVLPYDGGDNNTYFLPAEERKLINGIWVMKTTGKLPEDDDFYVYNVIIDRAHAPVEVGGWGWSQWVYHPASAVYVFGIGALPSIVIGGMIVGKATGKA